MTRRAWLRLAGWLVVGTCIAHWIPVGGVPLARLQYEIWSDDPRFCARCHPMQTRFVSWRRSAHGAVADCMSCHAEPGAIGWLVAHLQGSRYVWAMLIGDRSRSVLSARVSDSSCLRCHSGIADRTDDTHARHRSVRTECTECHTSTVFHSPRLRTPPAVDHTACTRCHSWSDAAIAWPSGRPGAPHR